MEKNVAFCNWPYLILKLKIAQEYSSETLDPLEEKTPHCSIICQYAQ